MKIKPLEDQIILPLYILVGCVVFLIQCIGYIGTNSFPFFETVFRSLFWGYHFVIWVTPYVTEGFINSFK